MCSHLIAKLHSIAICDLMVIESGFCRVFYLLWCIKTKTSLITWLVFFLPFAACLGCSNSRILVCGRVVNNGGFYVNPYVSSLCLLFSDGK